MLITRSEYVMVIIFNRVLIMTETFKVLARKTFFNQKNPTRAEFTKSLLTTLT